MQSTTLPPRAPWAGRRPRAARPRPPRPELTGERETRDGGSGGAQATAAARALKRGGHGAKRTSSAAETAAMAGSGRRVPRPSPLPSRCGPPPSPFLCRRERRRRQPRLATSPGSRRPRREQGASVAAPSALERARGACTAAAANPAWAWGSGEPAPARRAQAALQDAKGVSSGSTGCLRQTSSAALRVL